MDSHCGWSGLLLLAVSVVFITQQCPHHQGPSLEGSPFVGMKPGSGPRVGDSDTGHHARDVGLAGWCFQPLLMLSLALLEASAIGPPLNLLGLW